MENLVWKEYLHFQAKGLGNELVWTRRFYVLYGQSERNQGRLDWYTSEDDFSNEISVRKTLYLESVLNVVPVKGEKSHFQINMKSSDVPAMKLVADNPESCQNWISKISQYAREAARLSAKTAQFSNSGAPSQEDIYEPPTMAKKFVIMIAKTEASDRCKLHGKYNLVVSAHHVSLQERSGMGATLYTWPYRLIRRYGKSSSHFNLEAGRKCDSGAGLFTFTSDESNNIFASVQYMTLAMKETAHSPLPRSEPTLPARSYDKKNYVAVHTPLNRNNSLPMGEPHQPTQAPKLPVERTPSVPAGKLPEYVNAPSAAESQYYDYDDSEEAYATIEGAESQYAEVPMSVVPNSPAAFGDSCEPYAEPDDDPTPAISMTQIAKALAQQRNDPKETDIYDHINLQQSQDHRGKNAVPQDNLYGSIAQDMRK